MQKMPTVANLDGIVVISVRVIKQLDESCDSMPSQSGQFLDLPITSIYMMKVGRNRAQNGFIHKLMKNMAGMGLRWKSTSILSGLPFGRKQETNAVTKLSGQWGLRWKLL